MACWDSMNIYSDDFRDDDCHGFISNNYPGCGFCSYCCRQNDYDDERIQQHQREQQEWLKENNITFICTWTNERGKKGIFRFHSSSLDKAREIAKESIWDWTTLLVEPLYQN
jgi:hypothetical protein